MVMVVEGGREDFNALAFGSDTHPGTVAYLQNQIQQFGQSMGGVLTDAAQRFVSRASEMIEMATGSHAMRVAKAALRRAGTAFQKNEFRPLMTIGDIQTAPIVMQRFIMAFPELRERYHKQQCDGYSDTYIDLEPDRVGVEHRDYRLVMDGMVEEFTNEDGGDDYKVTHYLEVLYEDERPLMLEDKVDIRDTWDLIKYYLDKGEDDPVDPFGGML